MLTCGFDHQITDTHIRDIRVKIYEPVGGLGRTDRPVLVYFHGGGWSLLSVGKNLLKPRRGVGMGEIFTCAKSIIMNIISKHRVHWLQSQSRIFYLNDIGCMETPYLMLKPLYQRFVWSVDEENIHWQRSGCYICQVSNQILAHEQF